MSDDLVTHLVAETRGWDAGLSHASAAMHNWEHEVKHVMAEVAGAFGIGFGIERTIESLHRAVEETASLAHTAEKFDVSVNSLIALQHQARMTHTDMGALEVGMGRMQVNLAEAAAGADGQAKAFRRLGIDVEQIVNLRADQQFAAIAEQISHMANATDRAEAARKVFGKGGIALMNMLKEGKHGFEEAQEYIRATNQTISELDLKKIEEADKSFKKMGETWSLMWRHAAEDSAPAISALGEFTDLLIRGTGSKWGGKMPTFTSEPGHFMEGHWTTHAELHKVANAAKEAEEHVKHTSQALAEAKADKLAKDMHDVAVAAEQMHKSLMTPLEKLGEEYQRGVELFGKGALSGADLHRIQDKMTSQKDREHEEATKPDRDAFEQMQRMYEQTRTPLEKFHDEMAKLDDMGAMGLDVETFDREFARIAADFKREMEENDPLRKMIEEAKRLREELKSPYERFEEDMKRYQEMANRDVIDQGELANFSDRAAEQYRTAKGLDKFGQPHQQGHEKQYAGAYEYGSKEAYSQMLKATNPHVDEYAKKQLELAQTSLTVEKDISLKMSQLVTNMKPAIVVSIPP